MDPVNASLGGDSLLNLSLAAGTLPGVANLNDSVCEVDAAPEVQLSRKVFLFGSMVFVTVGLVTNLLNVLVFSSKDMCKISSSIYLLTLAASDALYLVSVVLTKILTSLRCMYFSESAIDIQNRSTLMCKLLQYLSDLFSDLSSCLILAFTIERFVAVYFPMKMKQLSTVRLARVVCAIVFAVVAVSIAPYHALLMGRYQGRCIVLRAYEEEFSSLYIAEAVVFRLVPVLVIAVLNASIIVRVAQLRRLKSEQTQSAAASRLNPVNGHHQPAKRANDDKGLQLTIMLILVSTTYIIFFIPVLVHFVVQTLSRTKTIAAVSKETLQVAQNYTRALYIVGFAINFFLYTMSGTIFREQLKAILCPRYKQQKRLLNTMAETQL